VGRHITRVAAAGVEAVHLRPIARQKTVAMPSLLGVYGDFLRQLARDRCCYRRRQQARGEHRAQHDLAAVHHAAFAPHSRSLAIAAPSPSAFSFAQTMLSATIGSVRTAVPKPQSTPAITRSRPTMSA